MTTISAVPSDSNGERVEVFTAASEMSGTARLVVVRPPLTIPRSQTYYWTAAWQRAEIESLADHEAGHYFESSDPDEVIRWLDAPDPDEQD